jgi:hypothetical protein
MPMNVFAFVAVETFEQFSVDVNVTGTVVGPG